MTNSETNSRLADDTVLVEDKLFCLSNNLYLPQNCYKKHGVTLSYDKTKLMRVRRADLRCTTVKFLTEYLIYS